MSILGTTAIEQQHAALRDCISSYVSSPAKGSPALTPQHTIHSDHSYVLSLWLCSDKVCPHATDFCLRVTSTTLIS